MNLWVTSLLKFLLQTHQKEQGSFKNEVLLLLTQEASQGEHQQTHGSAQGVRPLSLHKGIKGRIRGGKYIISPDSLIWLLSLSKQFD